MSSFKYSNYLKSDHWFTLKTNALTFYDCKCAVYGVKNANNDVHHIKYKKLYNVCISDLRVLCRECHIKVHNMLKNKIMLFEQIKQTSTNNIWNTTLNELGIPVNERLTVPKKTNVKRFKHKCLDMQKSSKTNKTSWLTNSSKPRGWKYGKITY